MMIGSCNSLKIQPAEKGRSCGSTNRWDQPIISQCCDSDLRDKTNETIVERADLLGRVSERLQAATAFYSILYFWITSIIKYLTSICLLNRGQKFTAENTFLNPDPGHCTSWQNQSLAMTWSWGRGREESDFDSAPQFCLSFNSKSLPFAGLLLLWGTRKETVDADHQKIL